MNAREEEARKEGLVKVFIRPQAIDLLLQALAWLATDLAAMPPFVKNVNRQELQNAMSKDFPKNIIKMIILTQQGLAFECAADFKEKADENGLLEFRKQLEESNTVFTALKRLQLEAIQDTVERITSFKRSPTES